MSSLISWIAYFWKLVDDRKQYLGRSGHPTNKTKEFEKKKEVLIFVFVSQYSHHFVHFLHLFCSPC